MQRSLRVVYYFDANKHYQTLRSFPAVYDLKVEHWLDPACKSGYPAPANSFHYQLAHVPGQIAHRGVDCNDVMTTSSRRQRHYR